MKIKVSVELDFRELILVLRLLLLVLLLAATLLA